MVRVVLLLPWGYPFPLSPNHNKGSHRQTLRGTLVDYAGFNSLLIFERTKERWFALGRVIERYTSILRGTLVHNVRFNPWVIFLRTRGRSLLSSYVRWLRSLRSFRLSSYVRWHIGTLVRWYVGTLARLEVVLW